MIFPVLCPVCGADSGRRVIPESPEVDSFVCGHCAHRWSEPASPSSIAAPPDPLSTRLWRLLWGS